MSDSKAECQCVIDCSGLHEIAAIQSSNLKTLLLGQLKDGVIAVPSTVWSELRLLYEDDANTLENFVTTKITMKKKYLAGAARIADKLNSGFSRGPYDNSTDLHAASIAEIKGIYLLTSSSQLQYYKNINCDALEVTEWVSK